MVAIRQDPEHKPTATYIVDPGSLLYVRVMMTPDAFDRDALRNIMPADRRPHAVRDQDLPALPAQEGDRGIQRVSYVVAIYLELPDIDVVRAKDVLGLAVGDRVEPANRFAR